MGKLRNFDKPVGVLVIKSSVIRFVKVSFRNYLVNCMVYYRAGISFRTGFVWLILSWNRVASGCPVEVWNIRGQASDCNQFKKPDIVYGLAAIANQSEAFVDNMDCGQEYDTYENTASLNCR